MPLIVIYNMPRGFRSLNPEFVNDLKKTVVSVSELRLKAIDVTVCFASEHADEADIDDENNTVIAIVELLFDEPERTLEVRRELAWAIHKCLMKYFVNDPRNIEVAIKKFNLEKDVLVSLFL